MNTQFLEEIGSPSFNCFLCIYSLSKYRNNIGFQFVLVEKLATFPYTELEFFIPQLVQILISFESESMALHDTILDLSKQHPHFCVLTFWNLQAYVFELKNQPDSHSFHVVRGFVNKLQDIMFNQRSEEISYSIRENLHPALMICASMGATIGLPTINQYVKPIILSQGRQQKSFLFRLANFHHDLTQKITSKNKGNIQLTSSDKIASIKKQETENELQSQKRCSESALFTMKSNSCNSLGTSDSEIDDDVFNREYSQDYVSLNSHVLLRKPLVHRTKSDGSSWLHVTSNPADISQNGTALRSMPHLLNEDPTKNFYLDPPDPVSHNLLRFRSSLTQKSEFDTQGVAQNDHVRILKANYYRKETEFMIRLQDISSRLSQVPKEARLTSLRAELSIINDTVLPSQIDIPQLLPATSSPNRKFHRILKLNITEACVLNSAERVPYLLLIEYLSEDMDFDPSSECNKRLISRTNLGKKLDTHDVHQTTPKLPDVDRLTENDNEADLGAMSVISLSNRKSQFLDYLRANMTRASAYQTKTNAPTQTRLKVLGSKLTHSNEKTRDLSAQIRIAAVMLKQLEKSGQANSEQSIAIKSRIISSMEAIQDKFESIDYQQIREISAFHDGSFEQVAGDRKIENDFKIGEDWATKRARIRGASTFGHLANWDLCSVIVKNGDDLQQEAFACQLISIMSDFWKHDMIGVWTKNMKIVITSFNSGLVQTINNALSVHSIKKTMTEMSIKSGENSKGTVTSIKDYFSKIHGEENNPKFKKAQDCFARSLAAYSIICYVLQIKDRHNGNIMLDNDGHIIHIDFGFILSNLPGSVGFEAAPFKLTSEYIDVLGGFHSHHYNLFVDLCIKCFLSLRRQYRQLVDLVDLMQKDSTLPCFKNGPNTSIFLKQRLQLEMTDDECAKFVETSLVGKSAESVYTRLYDQFQLLTQGIYN